MRMQCHKKLYCTGQNDEIKSRRRLKILEMSEIKATENFYDYGINEMGVVLGVFLKWVWS